MTDEERRELDDAMQAHDRLMTEDEAWMARREAAREAPVRETAPDDVLYRDSPNNAQASPAAADPAPGDGPDAYSKAIIEFVVAWVDEKLTKEGAQWRKQLGILKNQLKSLGQDLEIDRANGIEVYCSGLERRLAIVEAENIKFKAMLGTTGGDADIIDLPDWRKRNDAA